MSPEASRWHLNITSLPGVMYDADSGDCSWTDGSSIPETSNILNIADAQVKTLIINNFQITFFWVCRVSFKRGEKESMSLKVALGHNAS